MKPTVFVHTNDKQMLGARVAAYLLGARSSSSEKFDIRIIRLEETPHLYSRHGRTYLRKGRLAVWKNDDLQSFSPLRMMVPELMGFTGRALLIDPDVFAVGDVYELLARDMQGKAILAKEVADGYRGSGARFFASSVMLLDCSRLRHWEWHKQIDDIFAAKLDYGPWISLLLEDPSTIGPLEEEWNHFDMLTERTKLLHNTERSTQPWKTGLPVDYDTTMRDERRRGGWLGDRVRRFLGGTPSKLRYVPHPDRAQELFFLRAVRECLANRVFDEAFLRSEMRKNHARHDLLDRIAALDSIEAAA